MDKVITSLTVLLTGFVVVFMVLFLLIILITVYGKILVLAQNMANERKTAKEKKAEAEKSVDTVQIPVVKAETAPADDGTIPEEIIAVIAAAVDSMYGQGTSARIKSVKKSTSRNAWGSAGVFRNTRPF